MENGGSSTFAVASRERAFRVATACAEGLTQIALIIVVLYLVGTRVPYMRVLKPKDYMGIGAIVWIGMCIGSILVVLPATLRERLNISRKEIVLSTEKCIRRLLLSEVQRIVVYRGCSMRIRSILLYGRNGYHMRVTGFSAMEAVYRSLVAAVPATGSVEFRRRCIGVKRATAIVVDCAGAALTIWLLFVEGVFWR